MFDIPGLQKEQARVEAEMKALNVGANSTDETLAKAESLTAEMERIAKLIETAQRAQKARGAGATGTKDSMIDQTDMTPATVPAQVEDKPEPGIDFARATRAIIIGKGNMEVSHQWASSSFGERHRVTLEIGAAMQANDFTGGGAFVPQRLSAELIPLLLPRTVMRRISRTVPLVGGSDNLPTVEKGINAHYIGEGQDPVVEEPQFGIMAVKERELAALCPISNKLLRLASLPVDMYVRDMMLDGFVQAEDTAFYRGSGEGAAPKGLRFFIPEANRFAANGTFSVANVEADLTKLELAMSTASIPMLNPHWLMHDRTFMCMRDMRDEKGKVYPSLSLPQPLLRGYPVERYNKIPTNLGPSGKASEIVFGDFAFSMVADSYQVRVDASTEASYKVGNEHKSAFTLNQTLIRGLSAHDYGVSRKNAFAVLTNVTWGAPA
ncbi:hypothetical protein [Azospirillum argentinense]|uniref:phage major capsid protein n=1 Tax=Azospirillum argentinense TaxID=2970906 RepID=UPI0032DEA678